MALKPVPSRRDSERLPNRCPDSDVLERIATAIEAGNTLAERNAAALESVSTELGRIAPLAEGMADLNQRLTRLCDFIKGHRLKIMAGLLALASTPGLIAPEVLAGIKAAMAAMGAAGG